MATKKHASVPETTDILGRLEEEMREVEIKTELVKRVAAARDSEIVVLETMRARIWKLLGSPFGSVRLGSLRFSRLMLLIGAGFFGMLIGSLVIGPVLGLAIVGCVIALGILWIRLKL